MKSLTAIKAAKYRVIYFGDIKEKYEGIDCNAYGLPIEECLSNDSISIGSKYSIPFTEITKKQFLTLLIEGLSLYEWAERVESFKYKYSDISDELLEILEQSKTEGPKWFVNFRHKFKEGSINKARFDFLSSKDKGGEANIIVNAKTIFVLPCLSSKLEKKHEDFIEVLKKQIAVFLSDPDKLEMLSFAKNACRDGLVNLHDNLVEKIFPFIHDWFFEKYSDVLHDEGPILLEGPTGTGKTTAVEFFAYTQGKKYIHVNISAQPENSVEARMRGCIKGVYTDVGAQSGWFEKANNGVLFLDEFQDAPKWVQTQLLDLLHPLSNQVTISKVGAEDKTDKLNVKLFIALNKPIEQLLTGKELREDLFHRFKERISFPSFKQCLKQYIERSDTDIKRHLKKIIWLYRCRHPLDKQNVSKRESPESFFHSNRCLNSLFLEFEDSAFDAIIKADWHGNFREFEKVIYKVYKKAEEGIITKVTGELIERILISFNPVQNKTTHEITEPEKGQPSLNFNDQHIIDIIPKALKNHNFVLKNALAEIKKRVNKINTAKTLNKYISKFYDYFPEEIKTHPKIVKINQKSKNLNR